MSERGRRFGAARGRGPVAAARRGCCALVLVLLGAAGGGATREPARLVDSPALADQVLHPTWRPSRPKVFIGPCRRPAPPGRRSAIHLTDNLQRATREVRRVDEEREAAEVYCTN